MSQSSAPSGEVRPGSPPAGGRVRLLLRVLVGLLVGLLVCELGLRAAGWLYLTTSRRGARDGAGPIVLCHGDSNVFGVYEEQPDTYPGHLQRLLDEHAPALDARVTNLGIPGLSSRQLALSLEAELRERRPRVLLITVGANNSWSWAPDATLEEVRAPWYEDLRLVKFARLVQHRIGGAAQPEAAGPLLQVAGGAEGELVGSITDREGRAMQYSFPGESGGLPPDGFATSLRADIATIRDAAAAAGVPCLLVGYGASEGIYGKANAVLREGAAELDLPFVPVSASVGELAARLGADRVFHPDLHPRGPGYEVIARTVFNALAERDLVPADALPDLLEGVTAPERKVTSIRLAGSLAAAPGTADELFVEIEGGEPGREFALTLWGLRDPGAPAPPPDFFELEQTDALFRLTAKSDLMRSRFDERGFGRISLARLISPSLPSAALAGRAVQAIYLVHGSTGRAVISRYSDPVELVLR